MSVWDDFIRRLEQDLAQCRSDLELLESGRMQNRERRDGGAWVDTTQRELDWHKKTIGIRKRLACTRVSYVNFARNTEGETYSCSCQRSFTRRAQDRCGQEGRRHSRGQSDRQL